MITTSNRAVEKLREQLVNKCLETGIGFRMLVSTDESGQAKFSIKLDRKHQGDEVIESNGVRVFLDPASAARISDYQLDYQDEPDGGFFLKTIQEAKGG
jgi:iron-sulfur cluster assembly protein